MAAIAVELPIKLKAPADYKRMSYPQLLATINELNAIDRFLDKRTYRLHIEYVGNLMKIAQRNADIDKYQEQNAESEARNRDIEAALQS
jgi:hypothetical protein